MNKIVWLILLAAVAVMVGVVIFSPQEALETPQLIRPVSQDEPKAVKTPPAVLPGDVPKLAPALSKPAEPAVQARPEFELEPVVEQQPEREAPTETQFLLCEHIISGVTQYGFSGEIRLINKGVKSVNGWSVTWEYEDGATIVEAEDVALSGNNPYTGEYLDWNAEIKPGQTVVFKFNGLKGGDGAPMGVRVTGDTCM